CSRGWGLTASCMQCAHPPSRYAIAPFHLRGNPILEIAAESTYPICSPEVDLAGDPLARSVLGALAYADLFDYPLPVDEIARYQIATSYPRDELACALANSPELEGAVSRECDFYSLRGREMVFEARRERGAESGRIWRRAAMYARILARLPF